MSYQITDVSALEILDSRGRPTLEVTLRLNDGACGIFGVPAGASRGTAEALELRDGDVDRFGGYGVTRAIRAVTGEIRSALIGQRFDSLAPLDRRLLELDGTAERGRLGANAIVGVSVAAAKAMAEAEALPLWRSLAGAEFSPRLPVPHFNVLNGGAHAANPLEFQELMIAPMGAPTFAEALRTGAEIYTALRERLRVHGLHTGLGDEGGFAPDLAQPVEALSLLVEATEAAGYEPGLDQVAFALDPAASGFQVGPDRYRIGDALLTSRDLVDYYEDLVARFPIWSIEDGMGEQDWYGWRELTERLGGKVQLVGDDIFVTDPRRISAAPSEGIANAALIKVNQVGTVTETLEAVRAAEAHQYRTMVSHRSGETVDSFIADLAVGIGCGQIKAGAPARGERVAKYNRLLHIETETELPFGKIR